MIEVRDLKKSFRDRSVLDGISFSIRPGEVVGFLGPNGAGKTTTMRILTGFLTPTSGSVKVAGHDVTAEPLAVKSKVGYLPELPPLYDEMRVVEYLRFVARMRGLSGERVHSRVDEVLSLCQLEREHHRLLSELSRGFRQRVGIAQALIADPDVLILDEPTSGLDPVQAARTKELIRSLAHEHTILFSTHVLSEVEAVADRVIVMVAGKIAADGPLSQLQSAQPPEHLLIRFTRNVPEAPALLSLLPGVKAVSDLSGGRGPGACVTLSKGHDVTGDVMKVAVERGWPLSAVTPSPPGLERLIFSILRQEVSA